MTTNPLVARIETGTAPIETLATLALEQHRVIPADRRAFLHLAQRETATSEAADFFEFLAARRTRHTWRGWPSTRNRRTW